MNEQSDKSKQGMSSEWDIKAAWMRKVGATHAAWMHGELAACDLGPVPVEQDHTETQRRFTAQAEEMHKREERRRVATASSGGPVKRLAESG